MADSSLPEKHALHLLLGDVDTGKTRFCRHLLRRGLARGWVVAVVDADIGQSWIGPPSTIGMKIFVPNNPTPPTDALYFVGAISPERHLPEMIAGVRQMVDRCWAMQVDSVLVDTTGFLVGDVALRLKRLKVEALMPDHVIVIQRGNEAEPLLRGLRASTACSLHVLDLDPAVRRKSRSVRREYRELRLRDYFHDATAAELDLTAIPVLGADWGDGRPASEAARRTLSELVGSPILYAEWRPRSVAVAPDGVMSEADRRTLSSRIGREVCLLTTQTYQHHLAGLYDVSGETFGLGWIQSIDWSVRRLRLLSLIEAGHIRAVKMGSYQWSTVLQKESV